MQEVKGNIWEHWGKSGHIVVVTTNNTECSYGMVFGAGIAAEAAEREPDLPKWMKPYCGVDYYSVIWPRVGMYCLQTKRNWKDESPLELVQKSIERLDEISRRDPKTTFHCPKFGCGHGKRDWLKEIRPLCVNLPDNVWIYV